LVLKFLNCDKIILNYINIGKEEGAVVLAGGEAGNHEGDLAGGYYIQPTVLKEQMICVYSRRNFWTSCSFNNI
jgi:acyl-CoA reductase-like NAD-dependent aldehyde dehydrogenase